MSKTETPGTESLVEHFRLLRAAIREQRFANATTLADEIEEITNGLLAACVAMIPYALDSDSRPAEAYYAVKAARAAIARAVQP